MMGQVMKKQMTLLRIEDNCQHEKDKFSGITVLTQAIENKSLLQLEQEGVFLFPESIQESDDLTSEQIPLQRVGNSYRTSNVLGFLGYGNERLIICTRFSNDKNDFFLQYLLSKVIGLPNLLNWQTSSNQDRSFFNFLVFLFPHYLKKAMRKGGFKQYVSHKYNNANPKGVIDIARHINENTPFLGKVAYRQREFSYDNDLMKLIRHTIEFIKRKSYGNNLLFEVKDEVQAVTEMTAGYQSSDLAKIIEKNRKSLIRHAYFQEYLLLQRLCLMILLNDRHQYGGGYQQMYGILFDGAWLWEEYIHLLVDEHFYHPMNKSNKGTEYLFPGCGDIYPDFIGKHQNPRIIADAKYKPIDNIHGKDYLQLLAYMFRFNCKHGFYFYPEKEGHTVTDYYLNQGCRIENNVEPRSDVHVTKLGFRVPQGVNSYDEFSREIKETEDKFVKFIEQAMALSQRC